MKKPVPHQARKMPPALFAQWRKPLLSPSVTGPHLPLAGEVAPKAEQAAARQEWEAEGGAVKPPIVDTPKLPL